ncbi:MAG: TetR/AcrR family transcriptional regulator [Pseudomonadota bacterium]
MQKHEGHSDRRYGGKSKEVRQAERRDLILEAAVSVYAEVGYHKATVRQICARAGLTSRYYYESFENGEDLFTACYEKVLHEFISKAVSAAQSFPNDRKAQTKAFQQTFLTELRDKPDLAKVFLIDVDSVSPKVSRHFNLSVDMIATEFAEQTPIPHGEEEVRNIVRLALVGGVLHIAKRWVEEDYATPMDTLLAATQTLYGLS